MGKKEKGEKVTEGGSRLRGGKRCPPLGCHFNNKNIKKIKI
uniref:Uncharacterized protein n=1 Tax=Vitis vinifera TaxID=29760 RepID=F6I5B7_VITVI